jgi:hypothetical protein
MIGDAASCQAIPAWKIVQKIVLEFLALISYHGPGYKAHPR